MMIFFKKKSQRLIVAIHCSIKHGLHIIHFNNRCGNFFICDAAFSVASFLPVFLLARFSTVKRGLTTVAGEEGRTRIAAIVTSPDCRHFLDSGAEITLLSQKQLFLLQVLCSVGRLLQQGQFDVDGCHKAE